jgi:hypothetical protein
MLSLAPSNESVMPGPQISPTIVYWHLERPPSDAEKMGEHAVEATSARVLGTLAYRDESWDRSYEDLIVQARARLEQEVFTLGGNYAHVLNESIESRHNYGTGESWLHGWYSFILYRHSQ